MSRGLFFMVAVKIPGLKYEFYRVVDGETRREIKINAISHFKYTAEGGEGWTQYSGPTFATFRARNKMADCIKFQFHGEK